MQQSWLRPASPLTLPWLAAVDFIERLSFFGMNAILVLYLTTSQQAVAAPGPGMGYGTAAAAAVAGSYGALVFLTPLLGGCVISALAIRLLPRFKPLLLRTAMARFPALSLLAAAVLLQPSAQLWTRSQERAAATAEVIESIDFGVPTFRDSASARLVFEEINLREQQLLVQARPADAGHH